ncbi:hypothetical protein ADL00_20530, partial [Streptomyces sp. AS58]|uniref:KR domain-containing protein n=1 Tax=Streptomyces sp. AS58 TaxID=1519489 RepID=UPI0006C42E11
IVVTRGATAVDDEDITDLPATGVTGLIRVAQTENPGRIVLADIPTGTDINTTAILATGEPQLALRHGTFHTPRLTPVRSDDDGTQVRWDEGTILITGATGTLGAVLARHLVTEHHAKHLLLLSRRGAQAPGATELGTELTALGADVTITACDVTDK